MRALFVLACCSALAALNGCGKSEAGSDAATGGDSSSNAGQPSAGAQAGASTSSAGSGGTAGGANGGAGGVARGGSNSAGGGVAGSLGGTPASGGAAPGQGGEQAEAGAGAGEGGASGLVDCDAAHALCRSLPPPCAAMHVPSIVGTCWGSCVKIDSCRCSSAQQCPDSGQYTCWAGEHCGPYVE